MHRPARKWNERDVRAYNEFHRQIAEDENVRTAARVDNNQHELVEALKKIGARCYYIKEPVDLVVGYRKRTILLEVKQLGKPLTQAQRTFFETWPGEAYLCHTIDEAISAVVNGAK